MVSLPHVYNMPSGVPFLPNLARGLKTQFGAGLQDALILLPTRRAVRELSDILIEDKGAALLPRMRPLADINPEEPPFEPGELAGLITPQMPAMQRRFEMARLVRRYHGMTSDLPLDIAGAVAMADPVLSILDDAAMEEVEMSSLAELEEIKAFAAEHFQNAAELYKIIQYYWPERLSETGQMEPMARRVALLKALTDLWMETPPDYPIIIAGSTGTLGATARLMRCVAHQKDGLVVLPGLRNLPDEAWKNVNEQHSQYSLKKLIATIGIDRGDVKTWPGAHTGSPRHLASRRVVISESLVPVQSTGDWPGRIALIRQGDMQKDPFVEALTGLSLIETRTEDEEALTIALILRETLEIPGKTAALVTPDPALARRVKARMRRWQVDIDYSQGEPLEETGLGTFLSLVADIVASPEDPVLLSSLFKHSLTAMGRPASQAAQDWGAYEYQLRRRRDPGKAIERSSVHKELAEQLSAIRPVSENLSVKQWILHLITLTQFLAATPEQPGEDRLWVGDAGEKAAALLEDVMAYSDGLGDISAVEFSRFLGQLMRGTVVRPRFGTHPRISILGPLEARMLEADLIILGGLNEGIWPARPLVEPFLSRGMRVKLGLSLPERRFGLSAHDFAELASNPDVILTRAERSADGPMVASRWIWRLKTLVKGALDDHAHAQLFDRDHYLAWARQLDEVDPNAVNPADRPEPAPPLSARWPGGKPQLSVTQIKTWIRDPYSIYAKKVLRLDPLNDLDSRPAQAEFGSALHEALEHYVEGLGTDQPEVSAIVSAFETALARFGFEAFQIAKDRARLRKIAANITDWIIKRRGQGWDVAAVEKRARHSFKDFEFTLTCKADLIERNPSGYAILDYKTGVPPSVKVLNAGFEPQLPLTGYLVEQGAFETVPKASVSQLGYIRLKGTGADKVENIVTKPDAKHGQVSEDYIQDAVDNLKHLVEYFQDPDSIYHSQPRIQYSHDYGDYDLLARRAEWAALGKEEGGHGHS